MGIQQANVLTVKVARRHGRASARPRRQASVACPLALWRTREPARISSAEVMRLAKVVTGTEILRERRWKAARAGDAAMAAAIAIDHLHRRPSRTRLTDVILGNLVVLSFGGDATAGVVIAHALRTLGRADRSEPNLSELARLWGAAPAFLTPAHGPASRRVGAD